jgi:hypothetical protein
VNAGATFNAHNKPIAKERLSMMSALNPAQRARRLSQVAGAAALVAASLVPSLAWADTNEELLKELRALKARVAELEKKIEHIADEPSGMTPQQWADFNRISVKTEAMEDSRDALGFKGLKISGYMDPTFIYNQRQNQAGFQFLNNVSDGGYHYDNSYFGAAVIDFTKETDGGARWRLTLAPNRGVGSVFNGNSPIQEASVSVPLTDLQTRLIAGQLPDWSGWEYLPATQNKLITHNLLFDFTLPTAYTGAGLELTRDKWIVKGVLANMNASKRSAGETAPVLAYRVDYAKGEFQGFGFAGVHGKAANLRAKDADGVTLLNAVTGDAFSTRDTNVNLFEADAYFIRGDWTLQGQLSYGQQKAAAITPDPNTGALRTARWWGLTTLAAYKFQPRLEGTVRYDYLNNRKNGGGLLGYGFSDQHDGYGVADTNGDGLIDSADNTERGVNRQTLTLGISYLFNQNTTLKAEYRLDRASGAVFEDIKNGGFKKTNQLVGASVLVSF